MISRREAGSTVKVRFASDFEFHDVLPLEVNFFNFLPQRQLLDKNAEAKQLIRSYIAVSVKIIVALRDG